MEADRAVTISVTRRAGVGGKTVAFQNTMS